MSALVTTAFFRRYALPAYFAAGPAASHVVGLAARGCAAASPRLVPGWAIDPLGRLVCRWTVAHAVPVRPD